MSDSPSRKRPDGDFDGPPIHQDPWRDPEERTLIAPKGRDKLSTLLDFVRENGGSDLHVSANNRAMIRIRGTMRAINFKVSDQDVKDLILPYMTEKQREELEEKRMVDFAFSRAGIGVFRVNVFHQRFGLAFVLRYLPERPKTIDELDLPSVVRRACYTDNGLVLVTGATGSGKSTTLAAMINEINEHRQCHIITIEDPVEYLHESKKSLVNQRSLGEHFNDFASALKAALREDPDVILVGEMRDRETMQAAIRAAETGHLVLSTLHTNSASKTVDRILNSFQADEQPEVRTVLAESLRLVISQKLIPNRNNTKLKLFMDIMVNTRGIANLIREGKTFMIENYMQTQRDEGMMLMDPLIRQAAEEGAIRMADAHEMANDKRLIEESEAFLRDEFGIVETVDRISREEFGQTKESEREPRPGQARRRPAEADARLKKEREMIGIKEIVAELKPGFRKSDPTVPKEERETPVKISRGKVG